MAKRTEIGSTESSLAPALRLLGSLDDLNCGLVATTLEGLVIAVNQTLLNWLGYREEEVLGQLSEELVPSELRVILREERRSAQAGDIRARLLALRRKDGTTFPAISLPHRIFDSKGDVIGGFGLLIELGTVQTAKRLGGGEYDLGSHLQRIALELEALGLAAQMPTGKPVPFGHPRLESLTPREKEVVAHLAAGHRVPTIAEKLFISPSTVRNHLKNVFSKLDVSSQPALIELVRSLA